MSEQAGNPQLCPTFGILEAELLMPENKAEGRKNTDALWNTMGTTPKPSPARARERRCGESADSSVPPFPLNRRDFVQARGSSALKRHASSRAASHWRERMDE